eukprot:Skav209728  [mRNA]  locus=scaffold528:504573:506733:- [translate_table: standard]
MRQSSNFTELGDAAELLLDFDTSGISLLDPTGIGLAICAVIIMCVMACCMPKHHDEFDSWLQIGEGAETSSTGILMSTIMNRIEKKFGSSYGKDVQKCVSSWKSKGRDLLQEAGVDFEVMKNLENVKESKTRPKKQLELIMTALKIFLMTHGAQIRQGLGLEMMGLDGCSQVLCGGDLVFRGGPSGYFCEWSCVRGKVPMSFDFLPAPSLSELSEKDNPTLEKDEEILKGRRSGPRMLSKLEVFKPGTPNSTDPLMLMKGSPDLNDEQVEPISMLYYGRCGKP